MGFLSRLLKTKPGPDDSRRSARPESRPGYRAVTVIADGQSACAAAQRISGHRFLTSDAPRLPLPDCDQATCQCLYRHFEDRRTDVRRDADLGIGTATTLHEDDRRAKRADRRASDLNE